MKRTLLLTLALCCGACATSSPARLAPRATARTSEQQSTTGHLERIPGAKALYFETDAWTLDDASLEELQDVADYLMKHPDARVTIAGHADERGPTEYNLMLGEARARAAKRYLVALGVSRDQVSVTTWGEERPAAFGSTEEAWSKNRRDELVVSLK